MSDLNGGLLMNGKSYASLNMLILHSKSQQAYNIIYGARKAQLCGLEFLLNSLAEGPKQ